MDFNFYLGRSPSNAPVHFNEADNSHIFICGRSGSGKSHFIKKLSAQAVEQGAVVLAFDYTSDFRDYVPPVACPTERLVVDTPDLTLNPLAAIGNRDADLRAQQLLSMINSVFKMGPRAYIQLRLATQNYIRVAGSQPTMEGLLTYMHSLKKPSVGVFQAMEPVMLLASLMQCGSTPISLDLTSPGLKILDFERVTDTRLRKIMVELILRTIFDQRAVNYNHTSPPIVFVLDESHSLFWNESGMAVKILREGRKFHLSGWFATQYVSSATTEAALSQAALHTHFRPTDKDISALAQNLSLDDKLDSAYYRRLVRNLGVGQFLMQTPRGRLIQVQVDP